jgi:hypothetical protein
MPRSWRASREVGQHWLFIEHTLELNDVLISALLLHQETSSAQLYRFEHERSLKRHPYKPTWQGKDGMQTFAVVPDAFLDFRLGGRRFPVLLEYDRGTEEQLYFRRKIRGYILLLKTGSYQQLFNAHAVTIAFTTFKGAERVEQMRAWTRAELEGESASLGKLFRFASFTRPLQPRAVWLEPHWLSPYDEALQPLLAA